MLGKLLKYEIPAMGRRLGPLFIAWFATSILLGLSIGALNGSGFFEIIAPLVYGMVTTAVFVMFVILIIQRYKSSLLGDEAYFNLTLPVSINKHIANKTISALIWTIITGLAALASVLIIGISAGGTPEFFDIHSLAQLRNVRVIAILDVLEVLIAGTLSTVKSILAIYAAITIGHQASHHTTLASIGAYIGLLIAESVIGYICIRIGLVARTHYDFAMILSDQAGFQVTMFIAIIVVLALSAAYFFICKYLMEKRLNLQ